MTPGFQLEHLGRGPIYRDEEKCYGEKVREGKLSLPIWTCEFGGVSEPLRGESSRWLEVWIWNSEERSRVQIQPAELCVHRNW